MDSSLKISLPLFFPFCRWKRQRIESPCLFLFFILLCSLMRNEKYGERPLPPFPSLSFRFSSSGGNRSRGSSLLPLPSSPFLTKGALAPNLLLPLLFFSFFSFPLPLPLPFFFLRIEKIRCFTFCPLFPFFLSLHDYQGTTPPSFPFFFLPPLLSTCFRKNS